MGKYDHLLSPVMVGNHLFKNRIIMTPTTPHVMQEDEEFPAEAQIQHFLQRAKNGAALITLSGLYPFNDTDNPMPQGMREYFRFHLDHGYHHYMSQLVEGIHGFGSYATIQFQHEVPADWDITAGKTPFVLHEYAHAATHQITPRQIREATQRMAEQCTIIKKIGFDGVYLHMSYQQTLMGRSLSPLVNMRDDEYGGTFENRIRLVTETCQAIKEACGKDFIIEAHITGEERDRNDQLIPGGWTIDDSVRFAEAMSGLIDILHLRGWDVEKQHPMWTGPDRPPYLYIAERCKQAVTETKILTTAGHRHPEQMEQVIAQGKADFIGLARPLIADPQFVEKLYDDQADQIRPCIACNRCFQTGPEGTPATCRCSVNPLWGFESRAALLFTPPSRVKAVAIVGGGPAGMQAAITCAQRGHTVTLFEKGDALGGQMRIADHAPGKWALKSYRDYLVRQLQVQGVEVRLGVTATGDDIERGGYDVVFAALGAQPKRPDIPGIDGQNVLSVLDVYGREQQLGPRVAIIGGGSSAIETGMHLAGDYGLDVTVLGRNALIAKELSPNLCRGIEQRAWEAVESLHPMTGVTVVAVTPDGVVYQSTQGQRHELQADTVIVAVGMQPLVQQAFEFNARGARLIVIGDCRVPGDVMEATREAYFAAMQV